MTGIYGAYISTEAFCIVFSLILLLRLKYGLGSEREIKILRIMFIWYIVLLITDIFWAMTQEDVLVPPRLINGAVNALADMAITWGCYYWYRFVAERSGIASHLGKTADCLIALPTVVISVMLIASVFNGWIFYIDADNHYMDTPLVYLRVGVNYLYLLLASAYSAHKAIRAGSRQERTQYLSYALFVLITIAVFFAEEKYQQCPLVPLLIFLAMLILYLTIYVDRETKILKQSEELTRSRVDIISSQIQPHFLYNALSVIVYYCDRDPQTAKEATLVFTNYLRENLNSLKSDAPVPFEQELAHVKNYLYLEKQRFEGRLNVEYDIQGTSFQIPSISVQPLVENAVRHGISAKKSGGKVLIATREEPDCWKVIVADDGDGFSVSDSEEDGREGGIDHVRRRVKSISGGTLTIESVIGSGTTATIKVPKGEEVK